MDLNYKGKVVAITGGGTGIGKCMALTFAREGADVAVCGRTPATIEGTAKEVRALGRRALAVKADVSKEADCIRFIDTIEKELGPLGILVNNAHESGETLPIADTSLELWNTVFATTLDGAMLCAREALKRMIPRKGGVIINISSIAGKAGLTTRGPYSAAKAGMDNMTRSLAQEYGPTGIRVNTINVGSVSNQLDKANLGAGKSRERAASQGLSFEEYVKRKTDLTPLRRYVEPQEIANLAAFLASDAGSGITAQCINCDCGRETR